MGKLLVRFPSHFLTLGIALLGFVLFSKTTHLASSFLELEKMLSPVSVDFRKGEL
jgi:hypothetical protein